MGRSVFYSQEEMDIIESGIVEIKDAFDSCSDDKLASLLLALDKYLDPYYKYNLDYSDKIFVLLEKLFISRQNIDIREDIRDLLFYGTCDYDIIASNLKNFDSDTLAIAIEVLANTYNKKYLDDIYIVVSRVGHERIKDTEYYIRELEENGRLLQ
jgi:hypothetical protein